MIGIGAYNQSIIHRDSLKMVAVTSIASGSDASQKKGSESTTDARSGSIDNLISKFGKSTKAEAFVGIALLVAVAVLVNTGLPASEFQNLIQQVQQAAKYPWIEFRKWDCNAATRLFCNKLYRKQPESYSFN